MTVITECYYCLMSVITLRNSRWCQPSQKTGLVLVGPEDTHAVYDLYVMSSERGSGGLLTIPSLTWPWLWTSLQHKQTGSDQAAGAPAGEDRDGRAPPFLGLEEDLLHRGLERAGLVLLQHLPAAPA